MAASPALRRWVAAVGAVAGWSALLLQLWLIVFHPLVDTIPVGGRIVNYFSFFTVLTNILVAAALTQTALAKPGAPLGGLSGPSGAAAVASYIAIVGTVYSLVLRELWAPEGLQALADALLHDVMPVFYVVYWLVHVPKASLRWMRPFAWLVYPLAYLLWTLLRGASVDWYPYPFVDARILPASRLAVHIVLLTAAFLVFGAIVVALDRLKQPPRQR